MINIVIRDSTQPTCILYGCREWGRLLRGCFPWALLWLELKQDIKHRQTNTVENCNTVAVKEKLGGLGKKRTSSKHLWRTNWDAKDSHLCLQNHLLSLSVSVSLALTLIHCSFFTYAPFVPHKIQAWQLRTLRPFGWNICSALAAFNKSAEPRWEKLKQREIVALNKAPIWADITGWGLSLLILSSKHTEFFYGILHNARFCVDLLLLGHNV